MNLHPLPHDELLRLGTIDMRSGQMFNTQHQPIGRIERITDLPVIIAVLCGVGLLALMLTDTIEHPDKQMVDPTAVVAAP